MLLQAAEVNFCDQRDYALSVTSAGWCSITKSFEIRIAENLSACLKTDCCFSSVLKIANNS